MSQKPTRTPDFRSQVNDLISVKRNQRIILVSLSLAGLCVLAVFGVLLLYWADMLPGTASTAGGGTQVQPLAANQAQKPNPVVLPSPTPPCIQRTLVTTTSRFQAQPVLPSANGIFELPTNSSGDTAYWYKGNDQSFVFSLAPTAANLALGEALKAGDLITVSGANCEEVSFTLAAPELEAAYTPDVSDQNADHFVLFIHNAPQGQGFVIRGSRVAEQAIMTDTPAPEGPGIQAEISLLDTSTSADKTSIQIHISIQNYGTATIHISAADVQLIPQGAEPLALASAAPALPNSIYPGKTKEFSFTFARPGSSSAVLRIFSIEYDVEGY